MKIKRLLSFGSALVLSLSSLLVFAPAITHATVQNCTWTGTSGDHKFSTSGNWSSCGGSVPQNGDNLIFPWGLSDQVPNNDITNLTVGNISFNGTASQTEYSLSGNAITLTGGITTSAITGGPVVIINSIPITISGDQSIVADNQVIILAAALSGSGALTIQSGTTGTTYLEADNSSYSGAINVTTGILGVTDPHALGATSAGTTIGDGASISFNILTSPATISEPLTLTGSADSGSSKILASFCAGPCEDFTDTLDGTLTLNNDEQAKVTLGTLNITGTVSGGHSLTLSSDSSGTLNVNGQTQTAPRQVDTYSDSQPSTDIDVTANHTAIVDGVRGAVLVHDKGILMGTGTVGALTVNLGGIVAPGHSPGCLNTGSLDLFGSYNAEIGGTTACTGYDQLKVTGTVKLEAKNTLNISLYNSFKPVKGQKYTIIDNDGSDAVTGTFTGLAEGGTVKVGTVTFQITYKGGTGNDVVLSVLSAPDTGFGQLTNSPALVAAASLFGALGIAYISRRLAKQTARR